MPMSLAEGLGYTLVQPHEIPADQVEELQQAAWTLGEWGQPLYYRRPDGTFTVLSALIMPDNARFKKP